jgi:hypothetical protein
MLQADALRRDAIQQGQLFFQWQGCLIYAALASGHPREQPLRRGHLFQMEAFGAVLGLPIGFEGGPELPVFLGVFVEDEEAWGA